jgi:hypothetical protein
MLHFRYDFLKTVVTVVTMSNTDVLSVMVKWAIQ